MIREIAVLDWLRFLAAFVLFLGPGYALLSFLPSAFHASLKRFSSIAMSFSVTVVFWAILFLWLKIFRLPLSAPVVFFASGAGWVVAGLRLARLFGKKSGDSELQAHEIPHTSSTRWPAVFDRPAFYNLLEAFTVLLFCVLYVVVIRNMVAGLGSDSFHHTLIAQMFLDQGQIPDNYLPYAPIISFSYHYGFHSWIAVLGWLSNWPVRLLVLVSGPGMVVLSGMAVAFLLSIFVRNRLAEWIGLVVVAFLAVFPAYMLNWGRYPQTLGMILALTFLSFFILWHQDQYRRWGIAWIAFLAIGLSLTHYRVTIMCAIGVLCFFIVELVADRGFRHNLRQHLAAWGAVVLAAVLLVAPWVFFTYQSHRQGVRILYSVPADSSFFSLERLGASVVGFPSNLPLLVISLAAIVWGLVRRDRLVIWIAAWWVALFLLSDPRILWGYMDRISYYIAIYVPFGLLTGWFAAQVLRIARSQPAAKIGAALAGLALIGWGTQLVQESTLPEIAAMVRKNDLRAMDWIRDNVAQDAVFMVNTYAFPFATSYIIGSDAGYWIPVLAERRTVVPPMSYQTERLESSEMIDNLVRLHALQGHLTAPETTALLRQMGIDYVYVGKPELRIQVDELLASKDYQLAYQQDRNYVFQLLSSE